ISATEKAKAVEAVLVEERDSTEKAEVLRGLVPIEDAHRLAADLDAFPVEGTAIEEEPEEVETAGAISPIEAMPMIRAKGLSADHVILFGFDQVNMGQASP